MNPREDDPDFAPHRPTFEDLRADYDDEFAHRWTPHERARRRLFVPAVAHIIIGAIGVLAMLVVAGFVLADAADANNPDEILFSLPVVALCGLGAGVAALPILGGVAMLRLRRHGLAWAGAVVVTCLSLAGCYGILFYPFGIWALMELYRSEVREQFGRPAPPPEADDDPTE